MNQSYTAKERAHLGRVKALQCSVCDAPAPSEAHHIEQSQPWTCVAVCRDCHTGPFSGWHGQKRAWTMRKMNELSALNITIKRLSA